MEYHLRKSTRIPGYNYASQNYYFITICTHEKQCIFGNPGQLNEFGKIAADYIEKIPEIFSGIRVEKYVVMPNHVHAILAIKQSEKDLPNLTTAVGQYKSAVTRKIHERRPGLEVWQRSFHDHIIRNQAGFEKIWIYIEGNPYKWEEDCFFKHS